MKSKFTCDITGVSRTLGRLIRQVTNGEELKSTVQLLHEDLETEIKTNLKTITTRDSNATNAGTGVYTGPIGDNIFSRTIFDSNKILGGTGDEEYMDAQDPFMSNYLINDISPKTGFPVRLWRILEEGAFPHTIRARKKSLVFLWKKKNIIINKQLVNHPGQTGRFYFNLTISKGAYNFYGKYEKKVKLALNNIINRYSYR